ncbi:MAG: methyltransferase, partial [Rhodospirillaceae bacterium]|nr:methyltransferase [Rhodospirillaceae bacterium]
MNQVEAELTYCVDDGTMPVNETKDAVTKMPTYSGNYDRHVMPIHDGRSWDKPINIEVNGFELVEHRTAMQDFLDSDELQSVYYPEMEALVKKHT